MATANTIHRPSQTRTSVLVEILLTEDFLHCTRKDEEETKVVRCLLFFVYLVTYLLK